MTSEGSPKAPALGAASSPSAERQPSYAWVVMANLWAMDLMTPLVFFSLGVLLPVWREDLGVTPFQAGLLGSSGFLGFGLMALPASIWLTRFNPRLVTLLCALGMAASVVVQAVAPTVEVLLWGRFAFVLLAVSRLQMQILFIQQWFQPRLYAVVSSLDYSNRSVGQTLGTAVTPVLVVLLGSWRLFYGGLAGLLVVASLVWVFLGRERQRFPHEAAPLPQVGSPAGVLWRRKSLWILAGSQIGAAAAFASFTTFFPTYALDRLGLSLTKVGLLMGLFPIGAIVGALVAGPLSQLVGRRKPFIWVPGLLLPITYLALLQTDNLALLALFLLASGALAMAVAPVLTTVVLDMGLAPREVAVAVGLNRTLFPLGATLGPLLVGALQQSTGSLSLGLSLMAPMSLTLFVGGILLPETGSRATRALR